MWDLNFPTRDRIHTSCIGSLNLWAYREVLQMCSFLCQRRLGRERCLTIFNTQVHLFISLPSRCIYSMMSLLRETMSIEFMLCKHQVQKGFFVFTSQDAVALCSWFSSIFYSALSLVKVAFMKWLGTILLIFSHCHLLLGTIALLRVSALGHGWRYWVTPGRLLPSFLSKVLDSPLSSEGWSGDSVVEHRAVFHFSVGGQLSQEWWGGHHPQVQGHLWLLPPPSLHRDT